MTYRKACKVLGVSEIDSLDIIEKRYYELLHPHHPDVSDNPKAHEITLRLSEAYNFIKQNYNKVTNNKTKIPKDSVKNKPQSDDKELICHIQKMLNFLDMGVEEAGALFRKYKSMQANYDSHFTEWLKQQISLQVENKNKIVAE